MKTILLLFFLLFILATPAILAQNKPNADKKAVSVEEDPDKLQPFELQRRKELLAPLNKAMGEVNNLLLAGKNANSNDAEATKIGYRLIAVAWQYASAQQDWVDWLADLRKAHKCLDCELDARGERLLRPKKESEGK